MEQLFFGSSQHFSDLWAVVVAFAPVVSDQPEQRVAYADPCRHIFAAHLCIHHRVADQFGLHFTGYFGFDCFSRHV